MMEAFSYPFFQHALLAGILAGIACGLTGSLVVTHRLVFLSGGIAHAAYGGVGLALFLGLSPQAGIFGFALLMALVMAWVSRRAKHRADTVIGVLWAFGMALGVVLADLTPGYKGDLMGFLFGSILTVSTADLVGMLLLDLLLLAACVAFYHGFVASAYDEEFARARGVPTNFLYFLLVGMVALSVVMVVRVVGLILVIAFLTTGPFFAEKATRSLSAMMAASVLCNAVFAVIGLFLAYYLNVSGGPAIILVAVTFFFGSLLLPGARAAFSPGKKQA
ncbi:MAG: metal ABC transporter permease [Thermodesulfobacteriota bacterium]